MGLDATIHRPDRKPLGRVDEVQRALEAAFPGIVLAGWPSGAEKLRAAAERGVVFPEVIRYHLESLPARHGGIYKTPAFSAEFYFGPSEVVRHIHVVLYGEATASEPMFAVLEERYGWVMTHP